MLRQIGSMSATGARPTVALFKKLVAQYPPKLRRALLEKHLFDARFELELAAKSVERGDVLYLRDACYDDRLVRLYSSKGR
jgi:hypothetical protein